MSDAAPESSIFEPVTDAYGTRLALVFGNEAPGGVCPYYAASCCHHCDIGAGEGAAFDTEANRRRLAWFAERYAAILQQVVHLVIYNSGSVLNPREMGARSLAEILAFARRLPQIRAVSLDTREAYVTPAIAHVARALGPQIAVRPIVGLETADDRIRNGLLEKRMPRAAVLRAFAVLGQAARELGADRIGLDVNVVVAGPGTTPGSAVADAAGTARFVLEQARHVGLTADLNAHPYYPSARGVARFPGHPRCPLPVAVQAVQAMDAVRAALSPASRLFIGWQDEGHDQESERRRVELAQALRDLGEP